MGEATHSENKAGITINNRAAAALESRHKATLLLGLPGDTA